MEYLTNYQSTIVINPESVLEATFAKLLSRVQVVPYYGVSEFLAIDMIATDAKFSYTPDVILFDNEHADEIAKAFINKGFPRVKIFVRGGGGGCGDCTVDENSEFAPITRHSIDNLADECALQRRDYIIIHMILILLAYDAKADREYVSAALASDFILMMAGDNTITDHAQLVCGVATNIMNQLNETFGIDGIDKLNSIALSGTVLRTTLHSFVERALNSSFGYTVCDDDGKDYRVVVVSVHASAHRIVSGARELGFNLSRDIIINYVAAGEQHQAPRWKITLINETDYPMESLLMTCREPDPLNLCVGWLFGESTTALSYSTITKKNDIIDLLFGSS